MCITKTNIFCVFSCLFSTGGPPEFSKQLKDRKALEGEKVTIKCLASGIPEPTFRIKKDGQVLDDRGAIKGVQIKHLS